MKKYIMRAFAIVPILIAITTVVSDFFAAAPCHSIIGTAELPEQYQK